MQSSFRKAVGVAVTVVAAGAIAVTAAVAAGTHSGRFQVYISQHGNQPALDIYTGSITDYGTDHTVGKTSFQMIVLQKGSFEVNIAKLNRSAKLKADMKNCTSTVSLSASALPLSHGTGAYKGITGTASVKATAVAIGRIKSGKCNLNATPRASEFTLTGTGTASY